MMSTMWKLTIAHLRMYGRDRQSVFFALFFPLILMLALGYMVGGDDIEPIAVSAVSDTQESEFITALEGNELLEVYQEDEQAARAALQEGDRDAVIFIPQSETLINAQGPVELPVLVNAGEPQQAQQTITTLRGILVDVEHEIRGTQPLLALAVEDVESRNLRYIDFLVPGLLAFVIMQLAIVGSGFNIVEYKRKGILKRLFVTPLRPITFIGSLIASRLVVILAQITLLLLVAKLAFDITIVGSLPLLYLFAIFGSILFLGVGFALGSIANTQNAVQTFGNLVIFPQVFLAGVFFPLDALPDWLQPLAYVLPLNFVSDALRLVINEGAQLTDLGVDIIGIGAWTILGVFLATWLFKWGDEAAV